MIPPDRARSASPQVAVIGIPDEERGEEVCAGVIPSEGDDLDGPSHKVLKRELRAHFAQGQYANQESARMQHTNKRES